MFIGIGRSRVFRENDLRQRIIASALHLLGSAVVISVFLLFVYFVWYPYPFDEIHSVITVLQLVIFVDLVLGPSITLIIFNTKKPRPELIRDLSLVILIQVAALGWGMYNTIKVRPLYGVILDGTVYSVTGTDVGEIRLQQGVATPSLWKGPKLVFIKPLAAEEVTQHVFDLVTKGGRDVMYQTERYLPLESNRKELTAQALDVSEFVSKADNQKKMDAFLREFGGKAGDYLFFPVENMQYRATVALHGESLEVVGLVGEVSVQYP